MNREVGWHYRSDQKSSCGKSRSFCPIGAFQRIAEECPSLLPTRLRSDHFWGRKVHLGECDRKYLHDFDSDINSTNRQPRTSRNIHGIDRIRHWPKEVITPQRRHRIPQPAFASSELTTVAPAASKQKEVLYYYIILPTHLSIYTAHLKEQRIRLDIFHFLTSRASQEQTCQPYIINNGATSITRQELRCPHRSQSTDFACLHGVFRYSPTC